MADNQYKVQEGSGLAVDGFQDSGAVTRYPPFKSDSEGGAVRSENLADLQALNDRGVAKGSGAAKHCLLIYAVLTASGLLQAPSKTGKHPQLRVWAG